MPAEAVLAAAALGGLAALLGALLLLAARWLEHPGQLRSQAVLAPLPGVNCDACGQPGCRAFAEALLRGQAQPAQCTVSTAQGLARLAALLQIELGSVRRRVAGQACVGDRRRTRLLADLPEPAASCAEAMQLGGGGKACAWACLGLSDCERACRFDAIRLDQHRRSTRRPARTARLTASNISASAPPSTATPRGSPSRPRPAMLPGRIRSRLRRRWARAGSRPLPRASAISPGAV